jgi:ABC-2 type transport system ATP-binding protein
MNIIDFDSVSKTYPKQVGDQPHTALSDITFHLKQGETLGLIGANGAGKSTTLRLIMGFLKPGKGIIRVFGVDPSIHLIRQRIGYLPETASFPSNLTIMDMLRFAGRTCLMPLSEIADVSEKWLKVLKLWEVRKRPLRNYSKGMQQRANFVLSLLNDPDLLVLDEPMSGLDPTGRSNIFSLIQSLKKAGKSILFCSHILEDVDRLVDNVLILHKGRNLYHGTVSDLCLQRGTDRLVDAFLITVEKGDIAHGQIN